jgi:hypothetical protein
VLIAYMVLLVTAAIYLRFVLHWGWSRTVNPF